MAGKIQSIPCFCAFVQTLGTAKDVFSALLDSLIALLQTIKATLLLVSTENLEDQARQVVAEAGLAVLEIAVQPIEGPFAVFSAYTRPYADCPPVAQIARKVLAARDEMLSDVDDLRYEIEQWKIAIRNRKAKTDKIDQMIDMLQDAKDLIDSCGA